MDGMSMIIRSALAGLFALALLGTGSLPAPLCPTYASQALAASQADPSAPLRRLKVGEVEQNGYMMPLANGTMSGIDAEYIYQIATIIGCKVDFVSFKDYGRLLDALERGEVDMAVGVAKLPEREERFLFSDSPFAKGELTLRVRTEDTRFRYGDMDSMKNIRIGVPVASSMSYRATAWAKANDLPAPIPYPTFDALEEALYSGEVDAIVAGDYLDSRRVRTVARLTPETYHPVFNKNNLSLKSEVDWAMFRISTDDPMFEIRLRRKYKEHILHNNIAYTKEEIDYMMLHPKITVAVVEKDFPYFDLGENGSPVGIIADFYGQISAATGMTFEFIPYENYEKAVGSVQAGQADVLGLSVMDSVVAAGYGLIITSAYSTQSLVEITRDGYIPDPSSRTAVASYDADTVRHILDGQGKQRALYNYRTIEDAFTAFSTEEADTIICGKDSAYWLLNHHPFANYSMSDLYPQGWILNSAMKRNNVVLNSILGKAAFSDQVDMRNLMMSVTTSQADKITYWRRMPVGMQFLIIICLMAAVAFVVFLMFYTHIERVKARAAVAESDLKAAESAKEAESNFLANMSHDLRTPLNGINGFTELALREDDPKMQREYLEKISLSAQLMRNIVSDVLELSKIERGKMEINLRPTRIDKHFDHVKAAVEAQAEKKNIIFSAKRAEAMPLWVKADALRMEQIDLNLLSNAIKYTPAGGTVSWHGSIIDREKMPPGKIRLKSTIQDDGIGMSEEFQKRMFDFFEQEQQEGTEHIKGTGLGLSIVKRLVDLMGGEIEVESTLGEGTTISVIYNLELAEPPEKKEAVPVKEGEVLKGMRILMCEDNEINAELAGLLLASKGVYEVEWAKDGQDGLERFRGKPPGTYDAILMDLRMPVMDGLTATKQIRALGLEGRQDAVSIPIIAMTADAYDEDVDRCIVAGMSAHLSKPININEVVQCLVELCHWDEKV